MHRQLSPSCQQTQTPQSQSQSPTPAAAAAAAAAAAIPPSFTRRKQAILEQLSVPDEDYTDLSPKGTIDAGIRDLIDEINGLDGLVTTSSCGGRVSVFLEGRRGGGGGKAGGEGGEALLLPGHHLAVVDDDDEEEDDDGDDERDGGDERENGGGYDADVTREDPPAAAPPRPSSSGPDGGGERTTVAGVGGKGGGGRWLFVSHEPVETHGRLDSEPNIVAALLGMEEPIFDGREGISADEMSGGESRLIHFKFEPMVRLFFSPFPFPFFLLLHARETVTLIYITLPPPFHSLSSCYWSLFSRIRQGYPGQVKLSAKSRMI